MTHFEFLKRLVKNSIKPRQNRVKILLILLILSKKSCFNLSKFWGSLTSKFIFKQLMYYTTFVLKLRVMVSWKIG